MVDIDKINKLPRNQTVIISTGSQGETMSALYRMAFSEHKQIKSTRATVLSSPHPLFPAMRI